MRGGGDRGVGHDGPDPLHEMVPAPRRRAATTSARRRWAVTFSALGSPCTRRVARRGRRPGQRHGQRGRQKCRASIALRNSLPRRRSPSLTPAPLPSIIHLVETFTGHSPDSLTRRTGWALRLPWVAPALLLALAVVVGVVAFVYVDNVNDDVDRKEEAARVLSQMQTSTARLGNLAALGSEPSLMLQAAGDAFALQVTLGQQLRRWDRVWDKPTPPAVAELRSAQAELTRRLRQAVRGNVRAGRASPEELAQGNRLYHRIDELHARVAADAADANSAGDTKTAVVTGVAIGFVVVMLALVQLARVRLRRMRRDTAMREALHEATRESEERYRYVTDLVPDQIFTIGADGRFDYMNERTAAFLGRPARGRCRPVARPAPPGRHAARAVDVVERDARGGAGRGGVPHAGRRR